MNFYARCQIFTFDTLHETRDDFIKDETQAFQKKNKHLVLKGQREYKTRDNKIAKIIEIEVDAPSNFESIAYIEEKNGIGVIVLSAKTKNDYEIASDAFDEVVSSYKFAGVKVEVVSNPEI